MITGHEEAKIVLNIIMKLLQKEKGLHRIYLLLVTLLLVLNGIVTITVVLMIHCLSSCIIYGLKSHICGQ